MKDDICTITGEPCPDAKGGGTVCRMGRLPLREMERCPAEPEAGKEAA